MTMLVEIKEIKVKQSASLDKEYRAVIVTSDSKIMELEKYIAEDVVEMDFKDGKTK